MKKMTMPILLDAIEGLSIYYPSANLDKDRMAAMAIMWLEDMANMDADKFLAAVKVTRKESKFFPAPAEIIENYRQIQNRIPDVDLLDHQVEPISLEQVRAIRANNYPRRRKSMPSRISFNLERRNQ